MNLMIPSWIFPVSTQTDIMDESITNYVLTSKWSCRRNMHVGQDSFGEDLEEEDPNR